jgi:hypothetical protein
MSSPNPSNEQSTLLLFKTLYYKGDRDEALAMLPFMRGYIDTKAPYFGLDSDLCSLLQYAIHMQDCNLVERVLTHGSSPNGDPDDSEDMRPINLALNGRLLEPAIPCVDLLLEHGASMPDHRDIASLLDALPNRWTPDILHKFMTFIQYANMKS